MWLALNQIYSVVRKNGTLLLISRMFHIWLICLHFAARGLSRVWAFDTYTSMWVSSKCVIGIHGIPLFTWSSRNHSGFAGFESWEIRGTQFQHYSTAVSFISRAHVRWGMWCKIRTTKCKWVEGLGFCMHFGHGHLLSHLTLRTWSNEKFQWLEFQTISNV